MAEFPLLTDEQIDAAIEAAMGSWYWAHSAHEQERLRNAARAVESATRAPLLAEIERLQALFDTEVSAWRRVNEQNDIRRRELLAEIERLTAELAAAREDAERYRWLRRNPQWLGWEHDFRPDEVEREIDAARLEKTRG